MSKRDIVITGVGIVSPLGVGGEAFWESLCAGRSGVSRLERFEGANPAAPNHPSFSQLTPIGGEVVGFNPKHCIRPRKSLKVMSREIQFGFVAADQACEVAELKTKPVDPGRLGIVFGSEMIPCDLHEMVAAYRGCMNDGSFDFAEWGATAMGELYPLWMLKYLPNMPACHIGIAQDARGPNNSLTLEEASGLAAVAEAVRVLQRGAADAMIVGGTSSRLHPSLMARSCVSQMSTQADNPAAASRPFDAERDGMVNGEGAGAFFLETSEHAAARGTKPMARILGYASRFEPCRDKKSPEGVALRRAITAALENAGIGPRDVGHVNANGMSTTYDDRMEALTIRETLGDVPVTAPKSFFGNLGAATGTVEMAASVLAIREGLVPATLNYATADPQCPVNVIADGPAQIEKPIALAVNHTSFGHAVAVVLAGI